MEPSLRLRLVLLDVLMNPRQAVPGGIAKKRDWRLLIVEDGDELIRANAKNATGQSLSRLLNVTDLLRSGHIEDRVHAPLRDAASKMFVRSSSETDTCGVRY